MQNLFRTALPTKKALFDITHKSKIVTIGSCFSNAIGEKLEINKFNTLVNPFGIVFNPLSIAENIDRSLNNRGVTESDIVFQDHLWHSWHHHGAFSNPDKQHLVETIYAQYKITRQWLIDADVLFITLGTAWAYKHKLTNITVANCHKVPQEAFSKHLLDADIITAEFDNIINLIKDQNPKIQIVLTVSPVKHLRDGMVENSLSKATLLVAIHKLLSIFKNVHYFPAYELLVDDLRDYRFYAEDMAHPNKQAEDYIWQYFSEYFFNKETMALLKALNSFLNTYNHKPIHYTPDYKILLQSLYKSAIYIQKHFGVMLSKEVEQIEFDLERLK